MKCDPEERFRKRLVPTLQNHLRKQPPDVMTRIGVVNARAFRLPPPLIIKTLQIGLVCFGSELQCLLLADRRRLYTVSFDEIISLRIA